uniref:rhomboid protease n=1 Tax=Strigamia maritima TaxID=126957 RepID=T1JDI7_STRMM
MSGSTKVNVSDRGEGGEAVAMVSKSENMRSVFDRYDRDHDGFIPLSEFPDLLAKTNIRHEIPQHVLDRIIKRADADNNGRLDYQEFIDFVGVFIYYAIDFGYVTASGPVPFKSPLIYDPRKRYEAWRYVSYMLIHAGCMHILFNMIIQLILGIPLEMVHKFWRVWLVYVAGVLAGSLGTSISDPRVYLAGASGGVYALITGHLATIIMNFQEMEYAIVQLGGFITLMLIDFGVAVYSRYYAENKDNTTGYSAHVCGAIAGLLVGIVALKNLEKRKWEKPLWWISLICVIIFLAAMMIWNVAFPSYFLPSKWES